MEIGVVIFGHVIVDDNVDSFDIDTSTKNVGGHHDAVLEILKILIIFDSFLLIHPPVDANRRELLFLKQTVQSSCPWLTLHKNNRL
jgi:hypothetical protein